MFVLADPANANKKVLECDRKFLTVEQIKKLKSAGWGVGCHTMTHNDLAAISGVEVEREVIEAKVKLEKDLRMEIPYIAYPLGNYTDEVKEAYSKAQYRMGLSMDDSYISRKTDLMIVPRVGVDGSHTYVEFIATISDAIIFLRSIVKKLMKKKEKDVARVESGKTVDVVVRYFWPVAAGTETNILETYSVMALKGWNVNIHTSSDTLTNKNILQLSAFHRGLWIRRYLFGVTGFWPRINWRKTDVVALHNFNVVPFYFIFLYTLFLKVIKKKRFVLMLVPHGGFVLYTGNFSFAKRLAISLFYHRLGVCLINWSVDGIRVVSVWEKEQMIKKGINKRVIEVIGNGTEEEAIFNNDNLASEKIKAAVSRYGKYIVQVGRIDPVKNYETVIKALKYIPEDINFVIAGPEQDINYKHYLLDLIEKEGMGNRVVFAGVVTGCDKYYLLRNAQLMVHLSLWESYCNAVHEGLSQGLVCIVSKEGSLPELIKNGSNGYCISALDYKTLAERVKTTLQYKNTPEFEIINQRNSKGVLARTWSDVADEYARMVVALI